MQNTKILITTSGIGQRLGNITKHTNKSLVRIGKKPALSYIIEKYPIESPIVITVGYKSDLVKQFIKHVYPDRNIEFAEVDNYDKPGSSLGYSILKAKNLIDSPFIFHATDTLVEEDIPTEFSENWIGVANREKTECYSTVEQENYCVKKINLKGVKPSNSVHIGLVGIYDYKSFFNNLEKLYTENPHNEALNDCCVINSMINKDDAQFSCKEFNSWSDIGNLEALKLARKNVKDPFDNLEKEDESIFLYDDFVVKFYSNSKIIKQRVARASILKGIVPDIILETENFYKYPYVEGELYTDIANRYNIKELLEWFNNNLWQPIPLDKTEQERFKKASYNFYYTKTIERIKRFLSDNNVEDKAEVINGINTPKIFDLLKEVYWDNLFNSVPVKFHGDLHFDNIVKTQDGFKLLDWRQSFDEIIEYGDIYYDLAKLNHGLIVSHDIIKQDLYTVKSTGNQIFCDIHRHHRIVECQRELYQFIDEKQFDTNKVDILTNLIYLNIAALHHYPYNIFLYYFGKYGLLNSVQNQ